MGNLLALRQLSRSDHLQSVHLADILFVAEHLEAGQAILNKGNKRVS